jgi:hypothetical protein
MLRSPGIDHSVLSSEVDGSEQSSSRPATVLPEKEPLGGFLDLRAYIGAWRRDESQACTEN